MKSVTLYTDGACSGNPGPGGWAAILHWRDREKILSGGEALTTNNRMELTAVIRGLEALKEPCEVTVYSDSRYVVEAMEQGWALGWRARGWKRRGSGEAKNPELWQRLLELAEQHRLHWVWVRGHAEDTSQSRQIATVQLYSGSTTKGSSIDFTSNSDATYTISNVGTWTATELHSAKLRFTIGVYGGLITGVTWTVTYSCPLYYTYTYTVDGDATIAVTISGGSTPPTITVGTPSKTIISTVSGYDQCVCTFTSNMALQAWEARATKTGTTPARGVGLLVESGTTLAAGANGTIYVENEELTNGDGEYTITVYGQSTGGVWSE